MKKQETIKSHIQEEYQLWKQNSPFLYDILLTKSLEWPSLTFSWSNKILYECEYYQSQQFIIGTQTSHQESNSLIVGSVKLPLKNNSNGEYNKTKTKYEYNMIIDHDGDVNRARICPINKNLVCTKSSNSKLYIYNLELIANGEEEYISEEDNEYHKQDIEMNIDIGSKANSHNQSNNNEKSPNNQMKDNNHYKSKSNIILSGHLSEGYGLSWSTFDENIIVSGSNDNQICVWDINQKSLKSKEGISPLVIYTDHNSIIEDVCCSPDNKNIFLSVSDDRTIKIWDMREKSHILSIFGHDSNINSIDINPINKVSIITGSSDNTIGLWDIRRMESKCYVFSHHNEDILCVKWNKFNENIFASSSIDRRINIWDISRIGMRINPIDAEDGPPELLFVHGGHISLVNEFDWNPINGKDNIIGSVEGENSLHIFEMASQVMRIEEDNEIGNKN